jgi:hypothetical protein
MNLLSRILSLLLLVSAALFYTNCGGGDDPEKSEEEIQLEKLKAGQWTLLSASDGTDRTSEYPGMTLTMSGTFSPGGSYSYTSTATTWPTLSPWKKDDTWKFKSGAEGTTIIRLSDSQEMAYSLSNSDKQLTIDFTYSGGGFDNNGRVEVVEGDWAFVFTRP